MIETYYDILMKIENFFDGIMIVDENCIIKYNKHFSINGFEFNEKASIGKTPADVWINLNEENSTCYRAVKYGETNVNQVQTLKYFNGQEFKVIDNTFPIKENGKIIGAISTSKFIESYPLRNFIDLSNMTTTYTDDLYNLDDIIGNSKEIQLLKFKIHKVSQTSSSVLIYGETGTGKELVAQSIHSNSNRKNECFISQNCAAIPDTLLESIFFGTTKGSYTGAENKPGIFEIANGGTIFLDEINSMNLSMQAKLLKAIEEKRITRIGGLESKKIDVRIIAAINEHPIDSIKNNHIRNDLFYRISTVQLEIPPLRERILDVEVLTKYYISYYNKEMNKNILGISDEVLKLFMEYSWPGNVRELKNIIEGAYNFTSANVIKIDDLPDYIKSSKDSIIDNSIHLNQSLNNAIDNFEKSYILSIAKNSKSLSSLADELKISRQTLNYKIKKYAIKLEE